MRSLVTGGAGFIGSHTVKRLLELGHNVVVLDNFKRGNKLDKAILESIELIEGDVRDIDIVMKTAHKCDLIFHFAAVLGVDIVADTPVETMETEVLGSRNIVKAAINNGAEKIIYTSTSGVYGKAAIERAVEEEFHVSPSSSYSIAKRYNEIYFASLFQEKGLQSCSLRLFNVYGPKQDNRMVIPRFFNHAMKGEPLPIFGNGRQTRDFTFIDDVIESIVKVADIVKGCEIINVSNNKESTIMDLARIIIEITGSKSEIVFIDAPKTRYDFEVQRRFGSSEKLKSLIEFYPYTELKEGLIKTWEFHKMHS